MDGKLRIKKGRINIIENAHDGDSEETVVAVQVEKTCSVVFGEKARQGITLTEGERTFKLLSLSPEAQAAYAVFTGEVIGKVRAVACKKAEEICADMGKKLES